MKKSNTRESGTGLEAHSETSAANPKNGTSEGNPPGEFVPKELTPEEQKSFKHLELTLRSGLSSFIDVGLAFKAIEDKEYYKAQYPTFKDYCEQQWQMSVSYAYRHKKAAECVEKLKKEIPADEVKGIFPINEAQVRTLTENLKPAKWATTWKRVVKQTGGKGITAGKILEFVPKKKPGNTEPGPKNKTGPGKETPNDCLETIADLVKTARSVSKEMSITEYKQLLDKIWGELNRQLSLD